MVKDVLEADPDIKPPSLLVLQPPSPLASAVPQPPTLSSSLSLSLQVPQPPSPPASQSHRLRK